MVMLINNQFLPSFENFINFFCKEKPTSCILYSKEGCQFKIHKDILGQTNFLCSLLSNFNTSCCQELEIFCPCSKDELEDMIGFLYEGKIHCDADTDFIKILENLTKIFGFPEKFVDGWQEEFEIIEKVCEKNSIETKIHNSSVLDSIELEIVVHSQTTLDVEEICDKKLDESDVQNTNQNNFGTDLHSKTNLDIESKVSDKKEEMPIIIPTQTLKVDKSSLKRKASQSFEKEEKKNRQICNLSNKDFIMKKYPRGNPSHCIQSIQKLSGYNFNESGLYCQTCDLLFNSEQDLELHKKNCKLVKESGEISVENVQKSNDFDHEKRNQSSISTLEPMPVSKKATTQSQDIKSSESKEIHCKFCPRWFTEQTNLNRHVSRVHRNVGPFSCESCKKAFVSIQEMLCHAEAEKGCFIRKVEQFPDSQGAMTALIAKPVLTKSAEHPSLVPAATPNDSSSVANHDEVKSSVLELEHFEHKRKQTPIPNIQQNETKQIIKEYDKKEIVFPDKKKTEDLDEPPQVFKQNNWQTNCEKCDLPFNSKQVLERHYKAVHKHHECPNCKIQFPSPQAVHEHLKSCAKSRKSEHKCEKCGVNFFSNQAVKIHKSRCSIQSPLKFGEFGCGKCDRKFSSKENLKNHYVTCHPKELFTFKKLEQLGNISKNTLVICPKCGLQFGSREQFELHNCSTSIMDEKSKLGQSKNKTHIDCGTSLLKCFKCKISFPDKKLLAEHFLKTHQIGPVTESLSQSNFTNQKKIFLCSKCNKQFSSKQNCLEHVKNCTGHPKVNNVIKENLQNDNNFACSECGKKFEFQSNLANHTLVAHRKTDQCFCPKCGGVFQMNLNQHMKICKSSEAVKNLRLQSNFNYKDTSSINKQPIVNPSTQISLQNFQNNSTDWNQPSQENRNSSFMCKDCNISFASNRGLLKHDLNCIKKINIIKENLQKDKKFPCWDCDKNFGFQSSLANHRLVVHKKAHEAEHFTCPKCGGAFANQMNLDQHLRFCEASEINVEKLC